VGHRGQLLLKLLIVFAIFCTSLVSVSTSHAQSEAGITKTEIVLGASYPMTGAVSPFYAEFFKGAQAYFQYLNDKGGIYGRKIRLVLRDDKYFPQMAIAANNALILKDKVFALFNSAPFPTGQSVLNKNVVINQRKIPNLAVMHALSEFSDASRYPMTFLGTPNSKQDFRVLTKFIETNLSNTQFAALVPGNDYGQEFQKVRALSNVVFSNRGDVIGSCQLSGTVTISTKTSGLLYGDSLCRQGSTYAISTVELPLLLPNFIISSYYAYEDVRFSKSNNIYTNFSMPVMTDSNDPFIKFFTQLFRQYSVDQFPSPQLYEGANAAYVVSQAISAIGPTPTRAALISFLRTKSDTLSTASFSPVNYSSSNIGDAVQYIAKFDGTKWEKVSDYYRVSPDGIVIEVVSPQRNALLPDGVPIAKFEYQGKKKITCVKGKDQAEIWGQNPKCPKGYKKAS